MTRRSSHSIDEDAKWVEKMRIPGDHLRLASRRVRKCYGRKSQQAVRRLGRGGGVIAAQSIGEQAPSSRSQLTHRRRGGSIAKVEARTKDDGTVRSSSARRGYGTPCGWRRTPGRDRDDRTTAASAALQVPYGAHGSSRKDSRRGGQRCSSGTLQHPDLTRSRARSFVRRKGRSRGRGGGRQHRAKQSRSWKTPTELQPAIDIPDPAAEGRHTRCRPTADEGGTPAGEAGACVKIRARSRRRDITAVCRVSPSCRGARTRTRRRPRSTAWLSSAEYPAAGGR